MPKLCVFLPDFFKIDMINSHNGIIYEFFIIIKIITKEKK